MIEWKEYGLSDIPFVSVPKVEINSTDSRINGQLFCREIAKEPLDRLKELIQMRSFPMIFLRSQSSVLGNGKSALMARAYWDLEKSENLLWAETTLNPQIRDLLVKILDSLIREGRWGQLKEKIKEIGQSNIEKFLKGKFEKVDPSITYAVRELLKAQSHEVTYVYSNIRRRIPAQDYITLFGALMQLFYSVGISRFTVFIDQFEEYIMSHKAMSLREKLGHELNDLLRAVGNDTTVVVSIHSDAATILSSSSEEISTFIEVEQSAVDLPQYSESDLLKMAKYYFDSFRIKPFDGDPFFPYKKEIVRYATHRTAFNPRKLMIALRMGMLYAAMKNSKKIDEKFLFENHKNIFGGYENKYKDFKSGDTSWETGII